jgi:hypothetical protein
VIIKFDHTKESDGPAREKLSAETQALRAERERFYQEMEMATRAMKEKKEILHQRER